MWRIEGKYCKECMIELGKDFDQHATLTIPKRRCDLCNVDFYFLKTGSGKQHKKYCYICYEAVMNGVIPDRSKGPTPGKVPQVMMIFAALGVLMMVLGLVYTVTVGASVQGILFGSATTAMGFILFKKTVRSRSLILGKARQQTSQSTEVKYHK